MPRKGSKAALERRVATLQRKLSSAGEKAQPASAALLRLGPPPSDSGDAARYLFAILVIEAHEVTLDPTLTATARRKEHRAIAIAAQKMIPRASLFEAQETIREDREDIERRKPRGPQLVPVPAVTPPKAPRGGPDLVPAPPSKRGRDA